MDEQLTALSYGRMGRDTNAANSDGNLSIMLDTGRLVGACPGRVTNTVDDDKISSFMEVMISSLPDIQSFCLPVPPIAAAPAHYQVEASVCFQFDCRRQTAHETRCRQ